MFDLPMNTHCYLVEPIIQTDHVKTLMASRFINFVNIIRKSKKFALKSLLKVVESDTRSVTGLNLRCPLLKLKAEHVQELNPKDESFKYREVPAGEEFRIDFIKEIIEVKNNKTEVPGFTMEELEEILQHLCGSRCLLGDSPFLLFFWTVFPEFFCSVPNQNGAIQHCILNHQL